MCVIEMKLERSFHYYLQTEIIELNIHRSEGGFEFMLYVKFHCHEGYLYVIFIYENYYLYEG